MRSHVNVFAIRDLDAGTGLQKCVGSQTQTTVRPRRCNSRSVETCRCGRVSEVEWEGVEVAVPQYSDKLICRASPKVINDVFVFLSVLSFKDCIHSVRSVRPRSKRTCPARRRPSASRPTHERTAVRSHKSPPTCGYSASTREAWRTGCIGRIENPVHMRPSAPPVTRYCCQ
jgi:hypothetical protein